MLNIITSGMCGLLALLSLARAASIAIRYVTGRRPLADHAQILQNRWKAHRWPLTIFYLMATAAGIAMLHLAPFIIALCYWFCAALSAMLSAKAQQRRIWRALAWTPLLPYCWPRPGTGTTACAQPSQTTPRNP